MSFFGRSNTGFGQHNFNNGRGTPSGCSSFGMPTGHIFHNPLPSNPFSTVKPFSIKTFNCNSLFSNKLFSSTKFSGNWFSGNNWSNKSSCTNYSENLFSTNCCTNNSVSPLLDFLLAFLGIKQQRVFQSGNNFMSNNYGCNRNSMNNNFAIGSDVSENMSNLFNLQDVNYNRDIGTSIARNASNVAYSMNSSGRCYHGVKEALNKEGIFLDGIPAYEAAPQLANNHRFKEVHGINGELKNLPAGAVVVWSPKSGHPYGHISVALGNGYEASDHVQRQMEDYSKCRVFIPTA